MEMEDIPAHIRIISIKNIGSGSKRGGRPTGSVRKPGCKKRPVLQSDMQGNFIALHKSIASAARAVECHPQSIGRCCRGLQDTTVGYVFKYAD